MHPLSRSMRVLLGLAVGIGLTAGACGDDDDTVETDPAQEVDETEDMTEDEMTEDEMTEDEMTEDEMTEDEMTEDEMTEDDMEEDG